MDTMAPLSAGTFLASVCDVRFPVSYAVGEKYQLVMDFSYMRHPYTFRIDRWCGGLGLKRFLDLFHDGGQRDVATFGSVRGDEDAQGGYAITYDMMAHQKVAAVLQAARDMFRCLDQILRVHMGSLLGYATWYLEKHGQYDSYAEFITASICKLVLRSNFLAPRLSWRLVQFSGGHAVPRDPLAPVDGESGKVEEGG
jgi:hypothetical protein